MGEVEESFARPVHAQVEGCGGVVQACSQRVLDSLVHLLHVERALTSRKERLDEHPLIPLSLLADLQVGGVA